MKKLIFAIIAIAGFVLAVSESSTFAPNILGLLMLVVGVWNTGILKEGEK